MFRFLSYIVGFLVVASLFRYVMAFLKSVLSDETASKPATAGARATNPHPQAKQPPPPPPAISGELKKCPACGTYNPSTAALTQSVRGETLYFCSDKCRQQHAAA